jgi:hypothetical protein
MSGMTAFMTKGSPTAIQAFARFRHFDHVHPHAGKTPSGKR